MDPHIFLGLRRKNVRHMKSVVRHAASCLRCSARGEKHGIFDQTVRQRNISPSILRPASYCFTYVVNM